MVRSSDGKMRLDFPNMSMISNPAAGHAMLLDHVKQEVRVVPLQPPAAPGMPQMPNAPGMPPAPKAPSMPAVNVKDLGKGMIEGHPVEGKQFTMHIPGVPTPPSAPALPGMPKPPSLPGAPQAPGTPQVSGAPQSPAMPKPPTVAEVWTSQTTGLPVLTKISGEFGQHTTYCKTAPAAEPAPSTFQPPPHYKWAS
jgi:hypothetical protein